MIRVVEVGRRGRGMRGLGADLLRAPPRDAVAKMARKINEDIAATAALAGSDTCIPNPLRVNNPPAEDGAYDFWFHEGLYAWALFIARLEECRNPRRADLRRCAVVSKATYTSSGPMSLGGCLSQMSGLTGLEVMEVQEAWRQWRSMSFRAAPPAPEERSLLTPRLPEAKTSAPLDMVTGEDDTETPRMPGARTPPPMDIVAEDDGLDVPDAETVSSAFDVPDVGDAGVVDVAPDAPPPAQPKKFPWGWVAGGAGVLAALVVIVVVLRRRRPARGGAK